MIVTIDGPAGSGKSTVARELAERIGFRFLDTGSMYRAVAWYLKQKNTDMDSESAVRQALESLQLEISQGHIRVNGREVSRHIRSQSLSQLASIVATMPVVREHLVTLQREISRQGNFVCEGRDQGTVVFPDSPCKFWFTASTEIRGRRRWLELREDQPGLQLDHVIAEQKIRDLRDETRNVGRLVKASDAIEIQVGELTLDQLVDIVEQHVKAVIHQNSE